MLDAKRSKILAVLGGYGLAFAGALAAAAIKYALTPDSLHQTQGGMQAFGDFMLFCLVFTGLATIPTAAALWFLRAEPVFWRAVSILGLVWAASSVPAWPLSRLARVPGASLLPVFADLRLMGSPLLAAALVPFVALAPDRRSRLMLGAAFLLEAVSAACWWGPLLLGIIADRLR